MVINLTDYRVYSVTPSVQLQYKLVERDNGTSIIIDRGLISDIYESTFTIMGPTATIQAVQAGILRDAHVTISGINQDEALFGDNINYTGSIQCAVMSISEIKQRIISSAEITLTVRANPDDLAFIGEIVLPSMACVSTGYWTKTTLGQTLKDSYTGVMTISDSIKDIYECELTTTLKLDDAIMLQNWFRSQRGDTFTMNQSDWGVSNPFRDINQQGYKTQLSGYPYTVRMISLSIDKLGVNHRTCTMLLRKEGA